MENNNQKNEILSDDEVLEILEVPNIENIKQQENSQEVVSTKTPSTKVMTNSLKISSWKRISNSQGWRRVCLVCFIEIMLVMSLIGPISKYCSAVIRSGGKKLFYDKETKTIYQWNEKAIKQNKQYIAIGIGLILIVLTWGIPYAEKGFKKDKEFEDWMKR